MERFIAVRAKTILAGDDATDDELFDAYCQLREALYGAVVTNWDGREDELRQRLTEMQQEFGFCVDLLSAMAVTSEFDPGPILDKAMLLNEAGDTAAAEDMFALSAWRSTAAAARDSDPAELVEANNSWAMACEAAIHNGRLLTAYRLAQRCSDPEDRAALIDEVRAALADAPNDAN